ncbi:MAG: hypothetical protein ACO1Q7_12500 [Gemmatimonas sp.]
MKNDHVDRRIEQSLAKLNRSAIAKSEKQIDAFAVMLKGDIQAELSHPGRGEPVRVNKPRFSRSGRRLPKQAREYHIRSRPGDPPAPDTNRLKNSAFVERDGPLARLVGVATDYARALEYTLNRPFMRTALERALRRVGILR